MKICDFVKPEIEYFTAECNFTEDERRVFDSLSVGNTIERTAEKCNMGTSTVKRYTKRIWSKIDRLKSL